MAPPEVSEDTPYSPQNDNDTYAKTTLLTPTPYLGQFDIDDRDKRTPDEWIPRNPELLRLTGRHPFNCEAPLPKLMEQGWITPTDLHYVRNHGAVPKLEWSTHTLEVDGLVPNPKTFTMPDLASLPSTNFPALLVCAGNRRKEQNMVRQSIGFSWGPAGLSNSYWKGVPLRTLLLACGAPDPLLGDVDMEYPKWVIFQGIEDLPKGKYATCVSYEVAMDPRCDLLVAYEQNGEPLAPDHGFPVRIVIPGHIGGRMVKWLARIVVSNEEDQSHYHFHDNRVLPPNIDAQRATAEGWWFKPEYIINELGINSVITSPSHDELLPIPMTAPANSAEAGYTFRGYAYTGGGRRITRVELSFDKGNRWELATMAPYPKEHIRRGRYWSWFFWTFQLGDVRDLVRCEEVWVRAWDSQNTQPEKLTWNVMGMMNNCYFRLRVHIEKTAGGVAFRFQQPAPVEGQGWMIKQDEQPAAAKPLPEPPKPTPPATPATQPEQLAKPKRELKEYTITEVEKHNTEEDCWIVVNGKVYACTPFLDDHPGGPESIVISGGTDCTEEFNAIHSSKAHDMLADYLIGTIATSPQSTITPKPILSTLISALPTPPPEDRIALSPREYRPFTLIQKTKLSHDTRLFRFALPTPKHTLGLPPGKHMYISATINSHLVIRGYTPITGDETKGYFDLLIKIYHPNKHPLYPSGGLLTPYLDSLPIGALITAKGPLGSIVYVGGGKFTLPKQKIPQYFSRVSLIAGGTGITPCYQILRAILTDPDPEAKQTRVWLLYANRTDRDMLMQDEIEELVRTYEAEARVRIWYTLSGAAPNGWMYGTGRIGKEMVVERCAPGGDGSLALVCGPEGMVEGCLTALGEVGYRDGTRFAF